MPAGGCRRGGVEVTSAEELRAEAAALQQRAVILVKIADVCDAVDAACEAAECPGCSCRKCPAYVGHPDVCLFVRLRGVVGAYFLREEEPPVKASELSEIIEVP